MKLEKEADRVRFKNWWSATRQALTAQGVLLVEGVRGPCRYRMISARDEKKLQALMKKHGIAAIQTKRIATDAELAKLAPKAEPFYDIPSFA